MTEAKRGFFPFIAGEQVSLRQGGAVAVAAKDNLQISQGGGHLIGAGNNVSISQGGAWIIGAGNAVTVDRGGAGVVGARHFRAEGSIVGVVFGRDLAIDDSRVLMGAGGSFLLGVIVGAIAVFLSRSGKTR